MSDESREPTLQEGIEAVVDAALSRIFVSLPARVERYDSGKRCVDAQPVVQVPVTLEDGTVKHERLPLVRSAPVLFPGSGPYEVTFPIQQGSIVILLFPSVSIERWLVHGREIQAGDDRRHTLNDAFAIPAGRSFVGGAASPNQASEDALVVHGADIRLGSEGAHDRVALLSDLQALKTFIVSKWAPVPMDGGASMKVQIVDPVDGWNPQGAEKVKAE